MSREMRFEFMSYSIRCERCKRHVPLYHNPEDWDELVCKKCLIRGDKEVK